jgi:hypothetical protein
MSTSSVCKCFVFSALAAGLAGAQGTPVRSLELEGDADAAGFTIKNLAGSFAADAGVVDTNAFAGATNALHGRIDLFNGRLDALVLDASPDLLTVAAKGDYADTLRVGRRGEVAREGQVVTGGAVQSMYAGTLAWDGEKFEGGAGRLAFGRARASQPGAPENPHAPADAWLLCFTSGGWQFMGLGPTNDLPVAGASTPYPVKWHRSEGGWEAYPHLFVEQVNNQGMTHGTGMVTNTVIARYEPVATAPEVAALGAEVAGLPRTLRDLAALDNRADEIRVFRELAKVGVEITGGNVTFRVGPRTHAMAWNGTRFEGEKSMLGLGRDRVVSDAVPSNPAAPDDRWLFVEEYQVLPLPVVHIMHVGPAWDTPVEDGEDAQQYERKWGYSAGMWMNEEHQLVPLARADVDILVEPRLGPDHEPVATLGDLAAYAKTVNGAAPDAGGNVALAIPPAPDLSAYVKKVNNTAPDAGGNVALAIPPAPTDETLQVVIAPYNGQALQAPSSGPLRQALQRCADSIQYLGTIECPPLKIINVQGDGNYDVAPEWDGVGQYVFLFPDAAATYELNLAAFNIIPNNAEVLLVFAMNSPGHNDNSCDVSIANWLGARSNVIFQEGGWFDTFTLPQDGRTPVVLAVRRCILGYMRDVLLIRRYQ